MQPEFSLSILGGEALAAAVQRGFRALEPPEELSTAEFSERYIVLPDECADPGPWRNDWARFQVGIMDALDDPACDEVAVKKSSQTGVSQLACNWLSRDIVIDPGTAMLVQPTERDAKDFLADKLDPVIRASEVLRQRVIEAKRGELGGSTARKLLFPGGWLHLGWSNSPASLSSKSCRKGVGDEVDRWSKSSGREGSARKLLEARVRTFKGQSKLAWISTPTIKGHSEIDWLYEHSDRRKWHVPCPSCGCEQVLRWQQVRWPKGKPEKARYHCEACEIPWTEEMRQEALRGGRWVAERKHHRAGFHVTSLMHPKTTPADMAVGFVEAKAAGRHVLMPWINHELAEVWDPREDGEQVAAESLEARSEDYPTEPLDQKVIALTMGVDTQDDRLELEVVGWGAGRESWSVDYHRILGSPGTHAPWSRLWEIITSRRWTHPGGYDLPIYATCVDSGGHHTQAVYRFCTPLLGHRVYAIKGRDGKHPIWPRMDPARSIRRRGEGHPVHLIGVDTAKDELLAMLEVQEPGPLFCHLPRRYPPQWFAGLASEERVIEWKKGEARYVWRPIDSRDREPLDCRIYAMAALEALLMQGLDLERLASSRGQLVVPESAVPRVVSQEQKHPLVRVLSKGIGR